MENKHCKEETNKINRCSKVKLFLATGENTKRERQFTQKDLNAGKNVGFSAIFKDETEYGVFVMKALPIRLYSSELNRTGQCVPTLELSKGNRI